MHNFEHIDFTKTLKDKKCGNCAYGATGSYLHDGDIVCVHGLSDELSNYVDESHVCKHWVEDEFKNAKK